jgi:outer membrane protein TolC
VLSAYQASGQSLQSLAAALSASQRAVTLANERYERGLTDFLNVVDAERAEFTLQDEYVQAQVNACEEFVALYRGLGGGWQNYQDVPAATAPLPAVAAMFRELLTRNASLKGP